MTGEHQPQHVLVIGATGSIGRLVVEQLQHAGAQPRALTRRADRARQLFGDAVDVVEGEASDHQALTQAVEGVDAVVMTHGAPYGSGDYEAVDYGVVPAVLEALGERTPRIALMTAIGVTKRNDMHDWKRRGERLLRVSGCPYTIVRPGWFDHNEPDQLQIEFLQGDRRQAGSPVDGVIARAQIAEVLVASLTSPEAEGKTFELVAEHGPAPKDLGRLLARLDRDVPGVIDGVNDTASMPLEDEPSNVRADVEAVQRRSTTSWYFQSLGPRITIPRFLK